MGKNARTVKDKDRDKGNNEDQQRGKKFDKKKYRLQKYSHKYKSTYTMYAMIRLGL